MSTQIFRFKYLPLPKRDFKTKKIIGEIHIPIIPIRISYAHRLGRPFHALVDSGAERNLFPADLGEDTSLTFLSVWCLMKTKKS